jgi:hypothetical protein
LDLSPTLSSASKVAAYGGRPGRHLTSSCSMAESPTAAVSSSTLFAGLVRGDRDRHILGLMRWKKCKSL